MTPQQTMDTQATLRATFARLMGGSPSERVASELTEMGVPKEAAQDVVARAVVILRDPRVCEVVASMEKQGRSAADAWEALLSSGVDRDAAQALVAEIVERRGRVEQKQRLVLVEEEQRRRERESHLDEVRSRRKDGWRKILFGGALLLATLLHFAIAVFANVWLGHQSTPFFLAVAGIIYIGMGILRLRNIASRVVDGWSD